jgi:2-polyprenyl-6-methoxyphenol hydroxylase-like FAD-dependent oxidoreductase
MKIAIVGAGIGGLTVAALLEEQGHQVKIFEKNDAIRDIVILIYFITSHTFTKLSNLKICLPQ